MAGASPPAAAVAVPVEDRLAELDLNSPTANAGLSVKEVRPSMQCVVCVSTMVGQIRLLYEPFSLSLAQCPPAVWVPSRRCLRRAGSPMQIHRRTSFLQRDLSARTI